MGWQDVIGSMLVAGATGDPMAFQRNKLEQAYKQFQMQKMTDELEMQREMHGIEKQKLDILLKQKKREEDLDNSPITGILKVFGITPPEGAENVTVGQAKYAAPIADIFRKQEKKPLAIGGKGVYEEGEFKEAPWADKEAFETFADPSGEVHWIAKGSDIPPGWKPYRPPSANVSVGVNVGGKVMTEVAKTMGETIVKVRADVQQAADSFQGLREAEKLLNSGVITGTGAEYILGAGKALQQVGFNFAKDSVANTQAFVASMGKQVGTIIKQFGSGTGLSDANREYAEKIVGGKITLTEEAIRKIISINKRAYQNVIRNYNKRAKQVMEKPEAKELPYNLLVEEPGIYTKTLPSGKKVTVEE